MRALAAALLFAMLTLGGAATAVEPDEKLADPTLEARAREISQELRCLVCQNQSIDDSNAELARDLRRIVRERLLAGDSDRQVIDFIVARYGEFVLLRPPFEPATWALWLSPGVIVLAGVGIVWLLFRRLRRNRTGGEPAALAPPPLSDEERRRLDAIVNEANDE